MAVWVVGAAFVAMAAGLVYVRSVGHDPERWHVDPVDAPRTGRPNDALALPPGRDGADIESPVVAVSPETLAARFDAVARAEPRVSVVAGGPETGFTTYVQRSLWIGWPDYVSVRAVEAGEGAALAIWSRSRFGYGDLGVNRARLEEWLGKLDAAPPG